MYVDIGTTMKIGLTQGNEHITLVLIFNL